MQDMLAGVRRTIDGLAAGWTPARAERASPPPHGWWVRGRPPPGRPSRTALTPAQRAQCVAETAAAFEGSGEVLRALKEPQ